MFTKTVLKGRGLAVLSFRSTDGGRCSYPLENSLEARECHSRKFLETSGSVLKLKETQGIVC